MKGINQRSILILGIAVTLAVIITGVILVQSGVELIAQPQTPVDYTEPAPGQVVRQYFTAWNNKDWPNMYATISDGFKKIDPNAKDLAAFGAFAGSQGIDGVGIISVKEAANDGTTATVQYSVEFLTNGTARKFDGTFTLKYRPGDVIRGWKLVHPYGPNVDAT